MVDILKYLSNLADSPAAPSAEERGLIQRVRRLLVQHRLTEGQLGSSATRVGFARALAGPLGPGALCDEQLVDVLAWMADKIDTCTAEEAAAATQVSAGSPAAAVPLNGGGARQPSLRTMSIYLVQLLTEGVDAISDSKDLLLPLAAGKHEVMLTALHSLEVLRAQAGDTAGTVPLTPEQQELFTYMFLSAGSAAAAKVARLAKENVPGETELRRLSAVAIAVDEGTRGRGWPIEAQKWLASATEGVLVRASIGLLERGRQRAQALAKVQEMMDALDRNDSAVPQIPNAMGPS